MAPIQNDGSKRFGGRCRFTVRTEQVYHDEILPLGNPNNVLFVFHLAKYPLFLTRIPYSILMGPCPYRYLPAGSYCCLVGGLLEVQSLSGQAEKMELETMKRVWTFLSSKKAGTVVVI